MTSKRTNDDSTEDLRGEFTRKIDEELLLQDADEAVRQAARIDLDLAERRRRSALREADDLRLLEEGARSIQEVLTSRSDFLTDRFSNAIEGIDADGRGVAYRFSASEGFARSAILEFRIEPNDTRHAFFVESTIQIGDSPALNDYITFPVREVPIPRVKKFVEGKILDLIRVYL